MYADLQEWDVIEVYHLEAVSGKSVMNHPEAQRMLEDIKDGHITGLIFSKLARLARNTTELLEFAEIFKKEGADLISLQEKIDTSSPMGRFFYRLISSLAEWERDEISSRVRASLPIRAKLGKPLGGEAPYGYKYGDDKQLEINEDEAVVRRLIFDLFLEHKRKRKVAKLINEMGYRTRKGNEFSDTNIHRYLRDTIVIGTRRVNYSKRNPINNSYEIKPKEEWLFIDTPVIVDSDIFNQCQEILDNMTTKSNKVRRTGIHLFSGLVYCHCGCKMYIRSSSPKYVCKDCKNKIEPDIIENGFHKKLGEYIFSDAEIQNHLNEEERKVKDMKRLLSATEKDCDQLNEKIQRFLNLFHNGGVSEQAFKEYHDPLYTELKQKENTTAELQGKIDAISMSSLASKQVLYDARNLHKMWPEFEKADKKAIIESVTDSVTVFEKSIRIKLNYVPTLVKKEKKNDSSTNNSGGGGFSGGMQSNFHYYTRPSIDSPPFFKLVQNCNRTLAI